MKRIRDWAMGRVGVPEPLLFAACHRTAGAVAHSSIAVAACSLPASRFDQAGTRASPRQRVSTQVPDASSRSQEGTTCVLFKVILGIALVTSLIPAHARGARLW